MMAAHLEPRAEDVEQFLALTEFALTRDLVIKRLKGNNNNLEQAIGEYFEDPASTKYHWDDSAFSSDRDGGMNHSISEAFDIQGPDDLGPMGGNRQIDGAPTRPPSRTSNNKSPIGKIIDLTAEHAMADPRMSMSTQDHQDRELRQALAESRKEAGLPPQEEGITGVDEIHFGPATRAQYEQGKWEMVPVGKSSVQEIVVDQEPEERKRDLDAPAFLKPSIANHRLNALMTIYHEIPLTRNVFLNTTDVLTSYGHDSEWWSGTRIGSAQISGDDDPPTYDEEVSQELQRLMAFLDKTERAYGSVDALASLDEVRRSLRQYADMESAVMQTWRNIYDNTHRSAIVRAIFSAGVESESTENDPKEFAILELTLPPKDSPRETLYDIADEILWPDLGNMKADSPYLSRIADVIAFRVEGGEEHKKVDIPAVWYPDRYLKSGREAALEMRIQKKNIMDKLAQISWTENRLTHCPLTAGRVVKVKDLFDATLRHDEAKIENGANSEEDLMEADVQPSRAAVKLSEELMKVMASIDKKLLDLAEVKAKAIEELKILSKLYTEPSSDPNAPKLHKYTLRGVSTNKQTMYICRRAEPDLIDMDLDGDETKTQGDQWWRIHYAPVGTSPVTVEKTSEIDVLHAAKHEGPNTLLVYASEKAMNTPLRVLPKPLEFFVHMDNKLFRSELPKSQSDTEVQSPSAQSVDSSQVGATSPGKRKYGDDEATSSRPRRVTVTERELRATDWSDFDAVRAATENMTTSMGGDQGEMIIGVDPSLISLPTYQESNQEMQEMIERPGGGTPMLGGRPAPTQGQFGTIDGMDLDRVVEDQDVREESAAVKRVGFVE